MYELDDYGNGGGLLHKFDATRPSLDFCISDSIQDMLDVDIRSEIATVVGSVSDYSSIMDDFQPAAAFDHAMDATSAVNHNNSASSINHPLHTSSASSSWFYSNSGPSWSSSSSDFYPDLGACVNPIAVMPLISSTLHRSPKPNLNSRSVASPSPASPNADETKSHLTFSPAQMKVSAGSMRHEQIISHIPKQIVTISSSATGTATTAPATLATSAALQRKNGMIANTMDTVKKDLATELRKNVLPEESKISNGSSSNGNSNSNVVSVGGGNSLLNGNSILNGSQATNTIKLAPGIGGLTFAYNKLKQQNSVKSLQASNGIIVKRERDSSPLRPNGLLNGNTGNNIAKVFARNVVQTSTCFTPKSIASAHSPHLNGHSNGTHSSPSSASSSPSSRVSHVNGIVTINGQSLSNHNSHQSHNGNVISTANVKSLQQKVKSATIESEYPKPAYSYSCLIAMALKNSRSGSLPVSEIYSFMCEHFPYFKTAPSGWKNSVRHNLSLNKCFEKIEKPATNGNQRKGCLWAMNPERISKMDEEVLKWSRKDPMAIRNAMVYPENLEALERGEMKHGSTGDSDVELDSQSEIEETSDLEEQDIDDTVADMFVEEEIEEDEDVVADDNCVVVNAADFDEDNTGNSNSSMSNQANGDVNGRNHISIEDINGISLGNRRHLHHHHQHHQQQQRDFDIDVEDMYDAIDVEDDKEAVAMAINNQTDIIELSPGDINVTEQNSPKRPRLDVNYSIGPVGELEKHIHRQQQGLKKFKLVQHHHHQQHQHQHQQQQQHILVQTIANGGNIITTTGLPTATATIATSNSNNSNNNINGNLNNNTLQHFAQFQQITAIPQNNRRKMQLVSRIA